MPEPPVMKLSVKAYDRQYLDQANCKPPLVQMAYHELPVTPSTAALAHGSDAVCVFVNDTVCAAVVDAILLRCAGSNNELNRGTHRAYNRAREGNFSLQGLLGHALRGRTVGIIGTCGIGLATARILAGFGYRVLACDPLPRPDALAQAGGEYASLDDLLPACDIVSLHCPPTDSTRHLIDDATLARFRPGAMLVNTSRGGIIDAQAVIRALKSKRLGALALDVYEAERDLFFDDHSSDIIQDDTLMRLLTFPNIFVYGHQAFFTVEALTEIAESTLGNLREYAGTGFCQNSLTRDPTTDPAV